MITSYFKTASRVITRNRVFSLINIIGLAASMSVGLLFIAILGEVFKYDQFHEKKDRIVRINTTSRDGNYNIDLATSSLALAQEIRDNVLEAEDIATLGYGFNGDFKLGDKIQSLKGSWASSGFFDVFTFPMISGNPATALREPNTMVIVESAALRIFGTSDVLGRSLVKVSTEPGKNPEFVITGVMKDIPRFSHMQFEALGSSTTYESKDQVNDWRDVWSNHNYVVLREGVDVSQFQQALDRIATRRNAELGPDNKQLISLSTQPITRIAFFSKPLDNQFGPVMPTRFLWLISGLSIIVLVTAGFNYTNLSVARASTRMREIGIRKVIGAKAHQVLTQFITESTVICLVALLIAFGVFAIIKEQFLSLTPNLGKLFELNVTAEYIILFIAFALVTGILSGIMPGLFFSKVNSAYVLRGAVSSLGSVKMGFRKVLVVVQYVFALTFITSTIILYKQYRDFVNFDLGFETNNVINIDLKGNRPEVLESKLLSLPEVKDIARSMIVTSTGFNYNTHVKGASPNDSLQSWYNKVNERYLDLFGFRLLAGSGLSNRADGEPEREVVVNRTLIRKLNIGEGDPVKAIGEVVTIDKSKLTIVGVVEDFHYSTIDRKIGPFVFRQLEQPRLLNVQVATADLQATMAKIEAAWKSIDDVHPVDAVLYDQQIEYAYREYSSIGKLVGFLAFLTVIICSLGLLGMVIFSAESRMKEMSIRRVMGARAWNVTYLLSRNFLLLLTTSAFIAIPLTWAFFTNVVLANVVYHNPIGFIELFSGAFLVGVIALSLVITQGLRVARRSPVEVLKSE